jgi:DNA polymerase (family 10)
VKHIHPIDKTPSLMVNAVAHHNARSCLDPIFIISPYHRRMFTNHQLAAIFSDIADRLDVQGKENVFVIRAYRAASENIANFPRPLLDVYTEGGTAALNAIKGIGKEIAKKIESLVTTGKLDFYEKLKTEIPDNVVAMLRVPTVGPKRVKEFWEKLGIDSVEALAQAAQQGKLRDLPKMGEKAEKKILDGIESMKRRSTGRMRIGDVMPIALHIIAALKDIKGVKKIDYAGSLRRGKETIGDLDILVATNDPEPVMRAFRTLPLAAEIINAGETKSTIRTIDGLQVDLRAIEPKVWGTAMQYFTGSQLHNIKVREHAQKKNLSLNEYAITSLKKQNGEGETFETEEGVYARLGMAYIPPEMREDRGEVEKALELGPNRHVLPDLITLKDLKGDLQMHTTWSDGETDVMGMARAAIDLGYEYILITDHTQSLGIVNGLTPERIKQQRKEIDKVNAQLKKEKIKFTVLQGAEVEVKSDGSLDLPDDVLSGLDLVQASVHTSLTQPKEKITARAIAAMRNPHIDILGHPSGRLINEREGADYDWEALFEAALENKVALEINSNPQRLDLNDVLARRAIELGCKLTISTDAHSPQMLNHMNYGVTVARRAWATPASVLNALPLSKLLKWVGK